MPDAQQRVLQTPLAPEVESSPTLSLLARRVVGTIRGRKIALLVAYGCDAEALHDLHAAIVVKHAVPMLVGARLGKVNGAVLPFMAHKRSSSAPSGSDFPSTPDLRYFVVRGRLWRKANPRLPAEVRDELVSQLMSARRRLRGALAPEERAAARLAVDAAKHALGERGLPWWGDGAPDYNRKLAKNTPYADWFSRLASSND